MSRFITLTSTLGEVFAINLDHVERIYRDGGAYVLESARPEGCDNMKFTIIRISVEEGERLIRRLTAEDPFKDRLLHVLRDMYEIMRARLH